MKNKKGKKLSLQKMKIAQLNRNSFSAIKGGTELPINFSNTDCHTDTCPDQTTTTTIGSNVCRTNERFCGEQL